MQEITEDLVSKQILGNAEVKRLGGGVGVGWGHARNSFPALGAKDGSLTHSGTERLGGLQLNARA